MTHNWIGYDKFIKQEYGTPFVYRALIQSLARVINFFTNVPPKYLFYLFDFLATYLILIFYERYLYLFLREEQLSRILSFTIFYVMTFVILLPRYYSLYYPYDMYSLLFNIILLTSIYESRINLFYLTFIIATFNRETTIFMLMAFLLVNYDKYEKKYLLKHGFCILFIWFVIKYFLYLIFYQVNGSTIFQHQYMSPL